MRDYETYKEQTKDAIFGAALVQLAMNFSKPTGRHHRQPWPTGDDLKEIIEKSVALMDAWERTTAP